MVWDARAFMDIAIGLFFLACGAGVTYALVRLAGLLRETTTMLHDVNGEFVPILTRLQTTVDEVNSELGKIDEITGSVVSVTDTIGNTSSAIQSAIGSPVKKVAGFSAGVGEALSTFLSGRRKEGR
jgi:ABC-type transporter Mla subunit MlaD